MIVSLSQIADLRYKSRELVQSNSKADCLSKMEKNKKAKWFIAHYLVVSTGILLAYMVLQNVIHAPDMKTYNPNTIETFLVMLNFPSPFILWIWMLSDYFKAGTSEKKVVWGWSLVFGNVLAALVYFVVQWRPRFRNEI